MEPAGEPLAPAPASKSWSVAPAVALACAAAVALYTVETPSAPTGVHGALYVAAPRPLRGLGHVRPASSQPLLGWPASARVRQKVCRWARLHTCCAHCCLRPVSTLSLTAQPQARPLALIIVSPITAQLQPATTHTATAHPKNFMPPPPPRQRTVSSTNPWH